MIIVTGASKGIGYAISQRLIDKGTDVLGLARDVSQLKFNSLSCDVSQFRLFLKKCFNLIWSHKESD